LTQIFIKTFLPFAVVTSNSFVRHFSFLPPTSISASPSLTFLPPFEAALSRESSARTPWSPPAAHGHVHFDDDLVVRHR
jgi:hypothetical protein